MEVSFCRQKKDGYRQFHMVQLISMVCFKIIQRGGCEAGEWIGLIDEKKNDPKLMTVVAG